MVKVWHFYKLESRFYPEITLHITPNRMLFIQKSLFYKKYKKYILKGWLFGLKLNFGDFSKKKENMTFRK